MLNERDSLDAVEALGPAEGDNDNAVRKDKDKYRDKEDTSFSFSEIERAEIPSEIADRAGRRGSSAATVISGLNGLNGSNGSTEPNDNAKDEQTPKKKKSIFSRMRRSVFGNNKKESINDSSDISGALSDRADAGRDLEGSPSRVSNSSVLSLSYDSPYDNDDEDDDDDEDIEGEGEENEEAESDDDAYADARDGGYSPVPFSGSGGDHHPNRGRSRSLVQLVSSSGHVEEVDVMGTHLQGYVGGIQILGEKDLADMLGEEVEESGGNSTKGMWAGGCTHQMGNRCHPSLRGGI